MRLLLLSSSRYQDTPYLAHAREMIIAHMGEVKRLLFIPYAGVGMSWDLYTQRVQAALPELIVSGIHQAEDPIRAVQQADAIAVGGGNTFHLLHQLYHHQLLDPIREATGAGTPYVGWSAGSNICGQSIRTTNDMPIIEPPSFTALGLIPCQINPHYTDYQAPGHNGETREQRLAEFSALEPQMPIVALPEGCALVRQGDTLSYQGVEDGWLFRGKHKDPLAVGADISSLLEGGA